MYYFEYIEPVQRELASVQEQSEVKNLRDTVEIERERESEEKAED